MAPAKPGRFMFDPGSIVQVRNRLGLSQKKLAALLGVPANTLSRWEIGATTPDADSLAAIYSVAAQHGISAQFFRRREKMAKASKGRTRLLVVWDFQTLRTSASYVRQADEAVRQALRARFPTVASSSFKAFSYPSDSQATDELMELGWGVWEDDDDLSDDIISQSKSDCGHEPENTILVLVTDPSEGDFVNLVGELRGEGANVYLMSSGAMERTALVKAVGDKHWIKLKGIPKAVEDRTRLLVFWDFEHLSSHVFSLPNFLDDADASVRQELDRRFSATSSRRFKAFVQQSPPFAKPSAVLHDLQKIGWRVEESDDIISQSKSDCGHEPENTILVLLTNYSRSDFVDLVGELRSQEVKVYIMSSSGVMERTALVKAVGDKHWIKLTGQVWSQVPHWV